MNSGAKILMGLPIFGGNDALIHLIINSYLLMSADPDSWCHDYFSNFWLHNSGFYMGQKN